MSTTMELVRFRVMPGREEEFGRARVAAAEAMAAFAGLESAVLSRGEDGTWVDVVLWRSREEALAADAAMQAGRVPAPLREWAAMITQVESFTHLQVVHQAAHSPEEPGGGVARTSTVTS